MRIEADQDFADPIWLYSLTNECLEEEAEGNVTLPIELCDRAGSLFIAGGIVSYYIFH